MATMAAMTLSDQPGTDDRAWRALDRRGLQAVVRVATAAAHERAVLYHAGRRRGGGIPFLPPVPAARPVAAGRRVRGARSRLPRPSRGSNSLAPRAGASRQTEP